MRSFLRYLLLFSVLIAATWVRISQSYDLAFPRAPGPAFDNQVRKLYINKLEADRPDMVMLGDSTLLDGVDPDRLSALTGIKVSSFDAPGSASAFCYLLFKNNIFQPK